MFDILAAAEAVNGGGGIPWQTLPGAAVLGVIVTVLGALAKAKLRPRGKFEFGDEDKESNGRAVCPLHQDLSNDVKAIKEGLITVRETTAETNGKLDVLIRFMDGKQPPIQM